MKDIRITLTIHDNYLFYGIEIAGNKKYKPIYQFGKNKMHGTFTDYCDTVINEVANKIAYRALMKLYSYQAEDKFRLMADNLTRTTKTDCPTKKDIVDHDGLDIVQTVKLAILILVDNGLVNNPNDINKYRSYIYRFVNWYSRRQAKSYNQSKSDSIESGQIDIEYIDNNFSDIENKAFYDGLIAFLKNELPNKANKENIIFSVIANCILGYTQAEIAKSLKVSQQMIAKYIKIGKESLQKHYQVFRTYIA